MNKTIKNIFTYLVIFLSITQIINYLYNNIYGSLIFFLVLSIGLYLITNKNIPVSLLITIVITNILNVSDVLDNNLFENMKEDRGDRIRNRRQLRRNARFATQQKRRQDLIDDAKQNNILQVLSNQIKQLFNKMLITKVAEYDNLKDELNIVEKSLGVKEGEIKDLEKTLEVLIDEKD